MPYATTFPLTQSPIAEGSVWSNGLAIGLDWQNVATTPGKAFGTQSGSSGLYDDSTALLSGALFGPDQDVSAVVFNTDTGGDWFAEVELRLRSAIGPHWCTGYEITASTNGGYLDIVRWNGPRGVIGAENGEFTQLQHVVRANVATGDVLRATAIGSTITAYVNGSQIAQVIDGRYANGSPGIGFWLRNKTGTGDATKYGFTSFSALDLTAGRQIAAHSSFRGAGSL